MFSVSPFLLQGNKLIFVTILFCLRYFVLFSLLDRNASYKVAELYSRGQVLPFEIYASAEKAVKIPKAMT